MAIREILLLGNPQLYWKSDPVRKDEVDNLQPVIEDLHDTLIDFRKRYGAGRAIAAPQIGVMKRLIYMCIDSPVVFINPVMENRSREMFVVWDDCMSFPELLVKVERHRTFSLRYRDRNWNACRMALADDLSELLQHEYDHLDGILAVSRAIDGHSLALKSQRALLEETECSPVLSTL